MPIKRLPFQMLLFLALVTTYSSQLLVAEPTIKNKNSKINSDLLLAVKSGNAKIAASILKQGANVNTMNDHGNSALYLATMTGRAELIQLLLQKGARVNQKNKDGRTALDAAVTRGSIAGTKILLNDGANANAKDTNGFTILMTAVSIEAMSRKLAAAGYKPDPKHLAGQADSAPDPNLTIIKLLLRKGATVTPEALDLAKDEPSIKKLLQNSKSPRQKKSSPR